jgi:multicomponent Na+:H+ antiporter subunit E
MMRRWVVAGVLFGALWVFVRGVELAVEAVVGQFLLGVAVGMPVAYLFRRLYEEAIDLGDAARSMPYAVLYVFVFLREVLVANLDVAYRVLAPRTPIEPQVIFVPLRVETDLGVTTIANSITITPGTLTLDHDAEENALYVHVIDGRNPEAIVEPIRRWEDYALEMFDEPLSSGDPAPAIAVHPEDRNPPPPADNQFDREAESAGSSDDAARNDDESARSDVTDENDGDPARNDDESPRSDVTDRGDSLDGNDVKDRDDREREADTEKNRRDGGDDDGR